MLIYETDTQYILEHENIRIIAEKKDYPKDYEAYLKAELEKVLQNTQNAPQTMMVDGRVYEVQQPEQPRLTEQSKWTLIRQKRNRLLAECDWTQVPDAPLVALPFDLLRFLRDGSIQFFRSQFVHLPRSAHSTHRRIRSKKDWNDTKSGFYSRSYWYRS